MERLHRKHYVSCQHQLGSFRRAGRDTRRKIVPGHVGVKNVDLIFLDEPGYPLRAEHAKGITDRHVKDALFWNEIEASLPLITRPQTNVYLISEIG